MKIKKATEEDIKEIQELNHLLFVEDSRWTSGLNADWPFSKDGKEYFRKRIRNGIVLVTEEGKKIVGYIYGNIIEQAWREGLTAEIENMLVLAELRGQGIGSSLLEKLEEEAKARGAARIVVEAFAGNSKAMEFYRKRGFMEHAVKFEGQI